MRQIIQKESHLKKCVTLVEISYVYKNELHLIKWVGNESNYLKWVTFKEMGRTCRNRLR